jgi:hypothetical protein
MKREKREGDQAVPEPYFTFIVVFSFFPFATSFGALVSKALVFSTIQILNFTGLMRGSAIGHHNLHKRFEGIFVWQQNWRLC